MLTLQLDASARPFPQRFVSAIFRMCCLLLLFLSRFSPSCPSDVRPGFVCTNRPFFDVCTILRVDWSCLRFFFLLLPLLPTAKGNRGQYYYMCVYCSVAASTGRRRQSRCVQCSNVNVCVCFFSSLYSRSWQTGRLASSWRRGRRGDRGGASNTQLTQCMF